MTTHEKMMGRMLLCIALIVLKVNLAVGVIGYNETTIMTRVPLRQSAHYDSTGNLEFFPAIVGGVPAKEGEFPSHVSIQTQKSRHICGGTLIDLDYVLTAAHCVSSSLGEVFQPNTLQIMGDDLTIKKVGGSSKRQVRNVRHIFMHPKYDPYTAANDIAVLKVVPFVQTNTLSPASLGVETPLEGEKCLLAGWGVKREQNLRPNPELFKAELTVTNQNACNTSYAGEITNEMFCAKGDGQDACQGDSGGALMCKGNVAGIVSFGNGCDQPNFPGVYTDVSAYEEFIDECFRTHVDLPDNEKVKEGGDVDGDNSPGTAGVVIRSLGLITICASLIVLQ